MKVKNIAETSLSASISNPIVKEKIIFSEQSY